MLYQGNITSGYIDIDKVAHLIVNSISIEQIEHPSFRSILIEQISSMEKSILSEKPESETRNRTIPLSRNDQIKTINLIQLLITSKE